MYCIDLCYRGQTSVSGVMGPENPTSHENSNLRRVYRGPVCATRYYCSPSGHASQHSVSQACADMPSANMFGSAPGLDHNLASYGRSHHVYRHSDSRESQNVPEQPNRLQRDFSNSSLHLVSNPPQSPFAHQPAVSSSVMRGIIVDSSSPVGPTRPFHPTFRRRATDPKAISLADYSSYVQLSRHNSTHSVNVVASPSEERRVPYFGVPHDASPAVARQTHTRYPSHASVDYFASHHPSRICQPPQHSESHVFDPCWTEQFRDVTSPYRSVPAIERRPGCSLAYVYDTNHVIHKVPSNSRQPRVERSPIQHGGAEPESIQSSSVSSGTDGPWHPHGAMASRRVDTLHSRDTDRQTTLSHRPHVSGVPVAMSGSQLGTQIDNRTSYRSNRLRHRHSVDFHSSATQFATSNRNHSVSSRPTLRSLATGLPSHLTLTISSGAASGRHYEAPATEPQQNITAQSPRLQLPAFNVSDQSTENGSLPPHNHRHQNVYETSLSTDTILSSSLTGELSRSAASGHSLAANRRILQDEATNGDVQQMLTGHSHTNNSVAHHLPANRTPAISDPLEGQTRDALQSVPTSVSYNSRRLGSAGCRIRVRSRTWSRRGSDSSTHGIGQVFSNASSSAAERSSAPMTFLASSGRSVEAARDSVSAAAEPDSVTATGSGGRGGRSSRRRDRADGDDRTVQDALVAHRSSARARRSGSSAGRLGGEEQLDYESLLELQARAGNVRRGLSSLQIQQLPEERFQSSTASEGMRECLICKNEYEQAERLRRLPCWHAFHSACIDKWLQDRKTCPLCRFEVDQAMSITAISHMVTTDTVVDADSVLQSVAADIQVEANVDVADGSPQSVEDASTVDHVDHSSDDIEMGPPVVGSDMDRADDYSDHSLDAFVSPSVARNRRTLSPGPLIPRRLLSVQSNTARNFTSTNAELLGPHLDVVAGRLSPRSQLAGFVRSAERFGRGALATGSNGRQALQGGIRMEGGMCVGEGSRIGEGILHGTGSFSVRHRTRTPSNLLPATRWSDGTTDAMPVGLVRSGSTANLNVERSPHFGTRSVYGSVERHRLPPSAATARHRSATSPSVVPFDTRGAWEHWMHYNNFGEAHASGGHTEFESPAGDWIEAGSAGSNSSIDSAISRIHQESIEQYVLGDEVRLEADGGRHTVPNDSQAENTHLAALLPVTPSARGTIVSTPYQTSIEVSQSVDFDDESLDMNLNRSCSCPRSCHRVDVCGDDASCVGERVSADADTIRRYRLVTGRSGRQVRRRRRERDSFWLAGGPKCDESEARRHRAASSEYANRQRTWPCHARDTLAEQQGFLTNADALSSESSGGPETSSAPQGNTSEEDEWSYVGDGVTEHVLTHVEGECENLSTVPAGTTNSPKTTTCSDVERGLLKLQYVNGKLTADLSPASVSLLDLAPPSAPTLPLPPQHL
eukprot:GHVQ01013165.1.p1 GENE.GHVQ01013165.1~~GHVQ01013165.1.p1  ORF type:complete len:1429 (+),score=151.28 GHVQ01013165.1:382-4668(+)